VRARERVASLKLRGAMRGRGALPDSRMTDVTNVTNVADVTDMAVARAEHDCGYEKQAREERASQKEQREWICR